ncbi:MAG: undecaprenyl-phosphate glucose phosphotransferase [Anaerolineae bacterium]|jgi:exopolysaccharide biosynthesis polyprenyl glycosylphosphotransferase|nr:undecaprenyl-phosphate glucose phosphotransferase [Anaerolineae bacterium]
MDERVDLPATVPESARSRRIQTLLALLLPLTDAAMLLLAFFAGYQARLYLPFFAQPEGQPPFSAYWPIMTVQVITILSMFYFSRLYHQRRSYSRIDQLRTMIGIITLAALLTNGIQEFFFRNTDLYVSYPRSLFFYIWIFSVLLAGVGREVHRLVQLRLRRRGSLRDHLLLVGAGRLIREVAGRIKNNPELGYHIVGVVTDKDEHQGKMLGIPILGNYPALKDIIDQYHVQQVIIALPDHQRDNLVELITMCQRGQVDIKVYPDIFAYMAGDLNVDDVAGTPLITVRDIALRGWKLSLKRGLDIFGSLAGLTVLSPFFLLTALIIKLESRGEVFFTQQRIGLDGRPFPMIKFRSMRPDAEAGGPGWTVKDDPRVTRIGKFMRRTSWDEIPQLINVLLGHMSLVGPRPEQPAYVEEFQRKYPRYMERHREMVGMTGWAQIHGLRGDTSIEQRTTYDLWYVENWSLWLDIKIILRTVYQSVFRQSENAY